MRDGRGNYIRLRGNEPDDRWTADQFKRPPEKVPWKAIWFAVGLFVAGAVLIAVGSLLLTGHITSPELHDGGVGFVVIGSLLFVPGLYHVVIAVQAWRGKRGWSFNDIPRFEDD